ncbi:hypothetical protein, partial [Sideroxydans sp. CL21]
AARRTNRLAHSRRQDRLLRGKEQGAAGEPRRDPPGLPGCTRRCRTHGLRRAAIPPGAGRTGRTAQKPLSATRI